MAFVYLPYIFLASASIFHLPRLRLICHHRRFMAFGDFRLTILRAHAGDKKNTDFTLRRARLLYVRRFRSASEECDVYLMLSRYYEEAGNEIFSICARRLLLLGADAVYFHYFEAAAGAAILIGELCS